MPGITQSRAIVAIAQNDRTADELKRLALLFDEILYLPPHASILDHSLQEDRSRYGQVENGSWYIEDFSWARDCVPGLSIPDPHLKGRGLSDVVCTFRDSAVMRPCQFAPDVWEPLPKPLVEVMHLQCTVDIADTEFLQNAGTDPSEFERPIEMGGMTLRAPDGTEHGTVWVNPPMVVNVSEILTMLAYYADKESASPIMLDDMYQIAMSIRLARLPQTVRALQAADHNFVNAVTFPERFGAAAYRLSGILFDDRLVEELSASEIVRLRNALKEPRQDFISTHLVALADLVERDPWSDELVNRIDTYVRAQLAPALRKYNQEGRTLWENTLGKGVVRFTELVAAGAAGGGAGGLVASVLPNASFWGLLLLGAAAGALKTAPKIVGDLVELASDVRKHRRNGLFYVRKTTEKSS